MCRRAKPMIKSYKIVFVILLSVVSLIIFVQLHVGNLFMRRVVSSDYGKETSILEPSLSSVEPSLNGSGYMLVLSYLDQVTAATNNVLSLMCLASHLGGVRVVEPFLVGSKLGLNTSSNWRNELRLKDVFSISTWEQFVLSKHYDQLVPFEVFLKSAPRKVVLVQYCTNLRICHPCGHEFIVDRAKAFCDLNGFELVGKVCITYGQSKSLTLDTFKNQLYSSYKKSDVVLLFDSYGGIVIKHNSSFKKGYRLYMQKSTGCDRRYIHNLAYQSLNPSSSVLSDATKYIQEYFNGTRSYISIMLRMEKIIMLKNKENKKTLSEMAKNCITNLLFRLEKLKKQSGLKHVFISLDVGTYGSSSENMTLNEKLMMQKQSERLISSIYGMSATLVQYEKTFSEFSTKTPGYIAMVQKTVAAMGKILVLVGSKAGSTFQLSAKHLHCQYHRKCQIFELNNMCS